MTDPGLSGETENAISINLDRELNALKWLAKKAGVPIKYADLEPSGGDGPSPHWDHLAMSLREAGSHAQALVDDWENQKEHCQAVVDNWDNPEQASHIFAHGPWMAEVFKQAIKENPEWHKKS